MIEMKLTKRTRELVGCILISLLVIIAIMIGSYDQRGYFALGVEPFLVPLMIWWVAWRTSRIPKGVK